MSYNEEAIKNQRNYHVPGCSSNHNPKKNSISISDHNTIKHELAKSLGAIMLSRFGDIKFTKEIVTLLNCLEHEVNTIGFVKDHADFITESVPNDEENRRVDLVNLNTDDRFEFETDHKIDKFKNKGGITIYI